MNRTLCFIPAGYAGITTYLLYQALGQNTLIGTVATFLVLWAVYWEGAFFVSRKVCISTDGYPDLFPEKRLKYCFHSMVNCEYVFWALLATIAMQTTRLRYISDIASITAGAALLIGAVMFAAKDKYGGWKDKRLLVLHWGLTYEYLWNLLIAITMVAISFQALASDFGMFGGPLESFLFRNTSLQPSQMLPVEIVIASAAVIGAFAVLSTRSVGRCLRGHDKFESPVLFDLSNQLQFAWEYGVDLTVACDLIHPKDPVEVEVKLAEGANETQK